MGSSRAKMLLSNLSVDPLAAWLHLERYVNRGSPSGFTAKYRPPGDYDPWGRRKAFDLPFYPVAKAEVTTRGRWPPGLTSQAYGTTSMPLHPMTVADRAVADALRESTSGKAPDLVQASPTASGRTLWLHGTTPLVHLKLHYPGILGRVRRELSFFKAIAGYELSSEITQELERPSRAVSIAVLPEIAVRSWDCASLSSGIAALVRDARPFPHSEDSRTCVPAFALWAPDRFAPEDPLLLLQLLGADDKPQEKLLEEFLFPIVDSYFYMVFGLGIMPELNAQNLLFELSPEGEVQRIVLRDLSRCEKLLHVRRDLGLRTQFESGDYKCVDLDEDEAFAQVRHSFSFDFKLSGYVLAEIVDAAAAGGIVEAAPIDAKLREYVDEGLRGKEHFFPPGGAWYGHDRILLERERPYVEMAAPPRYRSRWR